MNGERLEKVPQKKQKNTILNIKIFFQKFKNLKSFKGSIEKSKKDYLKSLKPLATRKSSEMFLEIIAKFQISLVVLLI